MAKAGIQAGACKRSAVVSLDAEVVAAARADGDADVHADAVPAVPIGSFLGEGF